MTDENKEQKTLGGWRPVVAKGGRWSLVGLNWLWFHASVPLSVLALVGVFLLGRQFSVGEAASSVHEQHEGHVHDDGQTEHSATEPQVYTCAMHPTVRMPDADAMCPICNMELVPVESGMGEDPGPRAISMTEESAALADVRTTLARRKPVRVEVRMVGKVAYDETRVKKIAAWVPGRIEKLYADFTGKYVNAGEPLVEIYTPELFVAQRELHLARDAAGNAKTAGGVSGMEDAMLEAAREKLRLWGLSRKQIKELEDAEVASEVLSIPSPIGGTIVHKQVQEGMYVKEGAELLTVADLSSVWVTLDLFESEMVWLRIGHKVHLTTEAYRGQVIEGVVKFIDPVLDDRTRTVGVRVEVDNEKGLLKPEMFVRGVAYVDVEDLEGIIQPVVGAVWTCSMHPQIRMKNEGTCPVCGMELVPMDSSAEEAGKAPLVVPAAAVLRTGKRAVVYVSLSGFDGPAFEGRTIKLGPRAGDEYIVLSGLSEGDEVVTNGNFKIDSALQILAKPSMMSMPSEQESSAVPLPFRQALQPVYDAYFGAWKALSDDDFKGAVAGLEHLHRGLPGVDEKLLSRDLRSSWRGLSKRLMESAMKGAAAQDIGAVRIAFEDASLAILDLQESFGHAGPRTHFRMYCPMAFDYKGAPWLQETAELLNPYFGASMLRCGSQKQDYEPGQGKPAAAPAAAPASAPEHHNH